MPHNAMRHTPPYSCLQVPAEKGQPHSTSRSIPELEAMCYPSVCFDTLSRSDQPSQPTHWPGSCQYQTHCLQQIPYTSIWCTPWAHHFTARLPWHSTPQGKLILVCCGHPWSHHPGSTLKWETGSCEEELCHHGQAMQHTSCTCFHYSSHNQACYGPWSSQVHQVHWWLDKGVPRSVQRHHQIPQRIQDLTPPQCPPHDTCPQEIPHHLMSEGQGTSRQDGMSRHDHPCRWTNGLGILHYLCSEGKWQAMSVLGSPWPQWGHLPQSSQDAHYGGSCSQVCALSLLHQVGCLPWILVNHPWPGLQLAYNFQQSLQKIPFPVTSLLPGLFPRHLPEEDGSDPWRMPRMYWNCRWHHCLWLHQGRTWCPPMISHADCLQIQLGVQSTENTCKGSSHQFLWLPLWCQWCSLGPGKGQCCTHLTSTHKHHQTSGVHKPSHIPKSLHPWSVHLDCPSARATQEGQTSFGTAPMMPLLSGSRKLSSVTPPAGTLTHHFWWQYKSMPHR